MKISFLGAARTVTGSCYVVDCELARFAIDCGLHQGNRAIELRNWDENNIYLPESLDFILLTHAHIDHSGLLPRFVAQGFGGPVYATAPTKDLLGIMLEDSARIQETEAKWRSTKKLRAGDPPVEPLYTVEEAQQALAQLQIQEYNQTFEPKPGIRVVYRDAGHILGSAFIEVWIKESGQEQKLVFSGDLGRPNQLLVPNPQTVETADFLFLESTYGGRNHKNETQSRDELAQAVDYSYRRGEKVIIPAFAVERTQELLYSFYLLRQEGRLPADMPVYVDSPLAIKATEIFRRHWDYYDHKTKELVKQGENPLDLPNLRFTLTTDESRAINTSSKPAVVIAGSGMANAGRIKHHLRHNIWKPGASIVFVGFQAVGTPGRRIVEGARSVRLLGDELSVKARIFTIGGFSGHAGQTQILDWLSHFRNPNLQVYLVHGEHSGQKVLAELIREKFDLTVHIPDYLDEYLLEKDGRFELTVRPTLAAPRIDWEYLLEETSTKLTQVQDRVSYLKQMGQTNQVEIRGDILDINAKFTSILSELLFEQKQHNHQE
ncbi:MAG: MBL fold metallo-hydrolase [Desulfovibrionales bacterium]|nr:MBL fold metallo-hydrolase [Desulfovibrionales bacterium]